LQYEHGDGQGDSDSCSPEKYSGSGQIFETQEDCDSDIGSLQPKRGFEDLKDGANFGNNPNISQYTNLDGTSEIMDPLIGERSNFGPADTKKLVSADGRKGNKNSDKEL
jgi:hypothetical protein